MTLRVLAIQLRHLGDVLLCTPALRALRRAWPTARVEVLTGEAGAAALAGNPDVDAVVPWSPERNVAAQAWALRRRGYDVVLDFHSHPRSVLLAWASGAPVRVGFRKRGPRHWLYTHRVPWDGAAHQARQKLALVAALGLPVDPVRADIRPIVAVGPEDRAWAAAELERLGHRGDRPLVAVSAVAARPFKQWGVERWAEVVRRLRALGCDVLLTHGPGEEGQAAAVAARVPRVLWGHGGPTVPRLAALYERCAVWIGNDGGPLHIAVAAGCPAVAVFRWTASRGWTDPTLPVLAFDRPPPQGCDLHCSRCPHRGCLAVVAPAEVVAAAEATLARATACASR